MEQAVRGRHGQSGKNRKDFDLFILGLKTVIPGKSVHLDGRRKRFDARRDYVF